MLFHGRANDVQNFMDLYRITCEKIEHEKEGYTLLHFKFPTNDIGHKDYTHANLKCDHEGEKSKTRLNLSFYTNSIHIPPRKTKEQSLHFDMQFGTDAETATYHFLDTDADGVIKKHVKIHGHRGKRNSHPR